MIRRAGRVHGQRGFTLLELIIALTIVGALLAIAFAGLRVGLAAWRQGEDRTEAHQHVRGVAITLARALGATHPYRASRTTAPDPVVLFDGDAKHVEFVTQAPPFPFSLPIAFTAVSITLEEGERPGLVVRQRALPNEEPFTEAPVVFQDPSVTTLELSYMDESGGWQDSWNGADLKATPRAVKISVGILSNGRPETLPPLTVTLRTAPP